MRIVFLGTPDFAVAALDALVQHGKNVVAVVTAPDKPAGRRIGLAPFMDDCPDDVPPYTLIRKFQTAQQGRNFAPFIVFTCNYIPLVAVLPNNQGCWRFGCYDMPFGYCIFLCPARTTHSQEITLKNTSFF